MMTLLNVFTSMTAIHDTGWFISHMCFNFHVFQKAIMTTTYRRVGLQKFQKKKNSYHNQFPPLYKLLFNRTWSTLQKVKTNQCLLSNGLRSRLREIRPADRREFANNSSSLPQKMIHFLKTALELEIRLFFCLRRC